VKASTQRQAIQRTLPPVSQEETRKKKMRSRVVDESDKPKVASISLSNPGVGDPLVTAAKAGDELAFENLVKRHQPKILVLARRYTRIPEDAEDVVQQTSKKLSFTCQSSKGNLLFPPG
jgi:Sigma-70 region 2